MQIADINNKFNKSAGLLGASSVILLALSFLLNTAGHENISKKIIAIVVIFASLIPWLIIYTSIKHGVVVAWRNRVRFNTMTKGKSLINLSFTFSLLLALVLLLPMLASVQILFGYKYTNFFVTSQSENKSEKTIAKYCDSAWSTFTTNISDENKALTQECLYIYDNKLAVTVDNNEVYATSDQALVLQAHDLVSKAKMIFGTNQARAELASWDQLPVVGGIPQELYLFMDDGEGDDLILKVGEVPESLSTDLLSATNAMKEIINALH